MNNTEKEFHHPPIIRITHWLNAIALLIMITSGLRIYNASPIFDFRIPSVFTLGGWLAGARQWHFFGMYLFTVNGIIYLLYNLFTKHGRETTLFRKKDAAGIIPMMRYYAGLQKEHPPQRKYNALQKSAYTVVLLLGFGGILSGIAIYLPVQLSFVTALFGNYDAARVWHFLFMGALVLFTIGHLFMVVISGWSNFLSMFTGWGRKYSEPPTL
ncbi:MAG: cytochrome b/b6 domain-containing protein [Ignavibacteriales bacterium]|nr:cytochrome b/b6 domain-containing protein [Ignavibacteriales bacterium]